MTPLALALLLVTAATSADSLSLRLEKELRPYLDQRAASGRFSGVVLVARRGTPIFSAVYGMADRARGVANTLETRFNLGSANKMWTAIAIAQLAERGAIDVEAPVGRYLPDLPNAAVRERVTIRHLLTHTSGLGSYFQNGFLRDRTYVDSMADFLPFFIRDSLAFEPGSRMGYSNAGFALLGLIIERVAKMSYYEYMRTQVLARFAPRNDAFIDARRPPADVATGYAAPRAGGEARPNWEMIEPRSSPAGGAFASALDMVAFGRALWGGKLVGMDRVRQFTTGQVPMGPGIKYAFGFGDGTMNGWRHVGHNGGIPGANAEFVSFPDHDIDLVVLANQDGPAATDVHFRAMGIIVGLDKPLEVTLATDDDPPAAAPSNPPAGADRLPDNQLGRRTAAFLAAYSKGTGPAMAAFLTEHAVPRADRTIEERAGQFETWYDTTGPLRFVRVVRVTASAIDVAVASAKDGPLVLTLTFEPAAPFRVQGFALEAGRR
ncbi:MAG: beta-lactamase family protein [Gemmatimonadetes bacterium]|nr:beta-lactamase family protein [Gemmatimonadota bacterium]